MEPKCPQCGKKGGIVGNYIYSAEIEIDENSYISDSGASYCEGELHDISCNLCYEESTEDQLIQANLEEEDDLPKGVRIYKNAQGMPLVSLPDSPFKIN